MNRIIENPWAWLKNVDRDVFLQCKIGLSAWPSDWREGSDSQFGWCSVV
jgi:hypothetical protein